MICTICGTARQVIILSYTGREAHELQAGAVRGHLPLPVTEEKLWSELKGL